MRRDHWQVGEAPLAALDFVFVGRGNLHQVTHGGRQHVLITFEVLVVLGKAPEGTGDIGRDRWLFRDDEAFDIERVLAGCFRQRANCTAK